MYEYDAATYGAALKANIEAAAAALPDLHAPVVVTVDLDTVRPNPDPHPADPVAERLLQAGLQITSLPGVGQLPLQRLHHGGAPTSTCYSAGLVSARLQPTRSVDVLGKTTGKTRNGRARTSPAGTPTGAGQGAKRS